MSNPNAPYDPTSQPQGGQGYPQTPSYPNYEDTRTAGQEPTQAYGAPTQAYSEPTQAYGAPATEPMNYGSYDETQAYTPSAQPNQAPQMDQSQSMNPAPQLSQTSQLNQTQPMQNYQEPFASPYESQQPRSTEFDGAAQSQPTQAFNYAPMPPMNQPPVSQQPQPPYGTPAPQGSNYAEGNNYQPGNNYQSGNGYVPQSGYGYEQQPAASYGGPGQVPPQIPPDGNAPFNGQQPPKNSKTPIIIASVVAAVLLIVCVVFAVIALNKHDDNKPNESPSSSHSQTSSPKSSDDPFDDPSDDPFDEPSEDPSDEPLGGGSLGSDALEQALRDGKTLEQAFSNPEVKKQLEQAIEESSGDTEGMEMDVSAKGNTLIYAIRFTDSTYDGYSSIYSSMLDGIMCSPMSEFAKQMEDDYNLKDAKVQFILQDSKGKTILDETYDAQSECDVTSDDYDSLLNND